MSTNCRNSWCYFCGLKNKLASSNFNIPLYGTCIIYHKGTALLKNYCNIENILSYWDEILYRIYTCTSYINFKYALNMFQGELGKMTGGGPGI